MTKSSRRYSRSVLYIKTYILPCTAAPSSWCPQWAHPFRPRPADWPRVASGSGDRRRASTRSLPAAVDSRCPFPAGPCGRPETPDSNEPDGRPGRAPSVAPSPMRTRWRAAEHRLRCWFAHRILRGGRFCIQVMFWISNSIRIYLCWYKQSFACGHDCPSRHQWDMWKCAPAYAASCTVW